VDRPVNPDYTRHHPKWYRPRTPIFWWLRSGAYLRFILRELTALFVGYSAILFMAQAIALGRGPGAWAAFQAWLGHPVVLAFHAFVLVAVLFHTITWLGLAPRALVVRLGRRRVPDGAVLAGHYAAWAVVSAAVAWLLVGR
jgi:fumarate reductase subunit C